MSSEDRDPQELVEALEREGYSVQEIAYVVYGLWSSEVAFLLKEHERTLSLGEPMGKFALGSLAIALRGEAARFSNYGRGCVAAVAAAFRRKEDSVYDCVLVARMWSSEEFAALVARTGPFGFRLSFSHFVAAARWSSTQGPESQSRAKRMVQAAIEGRFTVSELKKALKRPV